ncbi:hypothetical protein MnTg04_00032 [bacterium MnTg04]|nr:hypothetical protein MnTg04_00032 [bacterium MnTg04]
MIIGVPVLFARVIHAYDLARKVVGAAILISRLNDRARRAIHVIGIGLNMCRHRAVANKIVHAVSGEKKDITGRYGQRAIVDLQIGIDPEGSGEILRRTGNMGSVIYRERLDRSIAQQIDA